MDPPLLPFTALAFVMGVKHAYDADHVLAVSNFLTRSKSLSEAAHMSLSWAAGHTVTAASITLIYYLLALGGVISEGVLGSLEPAAGVLLVVVGAVSVLFTLTRPVVHEHPHRHLSGDVHSHPHTHRIGHIGLLHRVVHTIHIHRPLFGIGTLQGLLSNDELLLLLVALLGVRSLSFMLGGLVVFSLGVVIGMLLLAFVIIYPLSIIGAGRLRKGTSLTAGSVSMVYGLMLLSGFELPSQVNLFS